MPYVETPNQNQRTGLNTLAYMGVDATTPNQFLIEKRDPTQNDYLNYRLGCLWLWKDQERLWMLMDKSGNVADWQLLHPVTEDFITDHGTATPLNGHVNVLGGVNIRTEALAPAGDTVTANLVDHPVLAGGLTITPLATTGVVTTDAAGLFNSTNGTNGQIIVARAAGPLWVDLVSAGGSVVISESLDPAHPGAINLEAAGGGGGGGIGGLAADIGGAALPRVLAPFYVDVFGSDVIKTTVTGPNTLTIDIEDSTAAGELLIGGGPGVVSGWGRLYSSDLSVVITPGVDPLNPLKQAINLTVAGGAGGFGGLKDDANVIAVPDVAHTVKLAGANGITTTTAGSTITIDSGAPNLDGRVLISSGGGGAATWRTLVAGANVTITEGNDGAGFIQISAAGGGGGGGIQQIDVDSGVNVVNPGTNIVKLYGAHGTSNIDHVAHPYQNILTSCPGGAATDTLNLYLSSTIQLPLTNTGGTAGVIMIGTNDFMHAYGTHNTFLGQSAGNRSLTPANATANTGIGYNSLHSLQGTAASSGRYNTAVGSSSLASLTGQSGGGGVLGSYNTAIGTASMISAQWSEYCTCVGYRAGYSYTTGESSNICIGNTGTASESHTIHIGNDGSGDNQQDSTYVAGIYNSATAATFHKVVMVDQNHKLSADAAITNGQVLIGGGQGPQWANITSTDGTVDITNGSHTIDLALSPAGSFAAYLDASVPLVTGDGTEYVWGTTRAFIEEYDSGGNLFPGDGAGTPMRYTASVDGMYAFILTADYYVDIPAPATTNPVEPIYLKIYSAMGVLTKTHLYDYALPASFSVGITRLQGQLTVYTLMTAGQYAEFSFSADIGTKRIGLGGDPGPIRYTNVAGFIISST